MRRTLTVVLLASLLLVAYSTASAETPSAVRQSEAKPAASPDPAASPGASPVVRASPSPSPAAAGASAQGGTWASIRNALTSDLTLLSIGCVLVLLTGVAWVMSNRAEATPNEDQLQEMRHFVNDHFAKYVARGLLAEGAGTAAVATDPAWRKVYLQHLRLHNELYAFRKDIALQLFEADIDTAVRRELDVLRAAGQRANPAVANP